ATRLCPVTAQPSLSLPSLKATPPTAIYTLSLHDALPISRPAGWSCRIGRRSRAASPRQPGQGHAGGALGDVVDALLALADVRLERAVRGDRDVRAAGARVPAAPEIGLCAEPGGAHAEIDGRVHGERLRPPHARGAADLVRGQLGGRGQYEEALDLR